MIRKDGRRTDQLREIEIIKGFTKSAPGSVLIKAGRTKVLCTATISRSVPEFLSGSGKGWITAEYGMLPGSTSQRKQRERRGVVDGRSLEIQRLIGRSLRAVVDQELLGELTIWVDCDVLEADGGTRTASITGGCIAVVQALEHLKQQGMIFSTKILKGLVAAVSVGIVNGIPMLDLTYDEDSNAEVDMNVVMVESGGFVEIQSTAEKKIFSKERLQEMLKLAEKGIEELFMIQRKTLTGL